MTTVTCTATDSAGNTSVPATFKVTVLPPDSTGPAVLAVETTGTTGVATITLTFSEPLSAPSATANNFQVIAAGRDKRIGTADDVPVGLSSVSFVAPTMIRLTPTLATAIKNNQFFRLTAFAAAGAGRPGISDAAGNPLDGNRNGTAGDDYSVFAGRGTKFSYTDSDRDTVAFALKTGAMTIVRDAATGEGIALRLTGTTSRSVLSGSVKRPRTGGTPNNGRTTLESITGLGAGRNNLSATQFIIPAGQISAVVVDSLLDSSELPLFATERFLSSRSGAGAACATRCSD
jgi:hypothetical protein